MVTKETKDVLAGKYGATAKPFNKEVQKKIIGDEKPITCRPADTSWSFRPIFWAARPLTPVSISSKINVGT